MAATSSRTRANGRDTRPPIHPDEEPTGVTIPATESDKPDGKPGAAPTVTTPGTPAPAEAPATTEEPTTALATIPSVEEQADLPPQLGDLIAYNDGLYRIYRTERRDGDALRNTPPEVAIFGRLERRYRPGG